MAKQKVVRNGGKNVRKPKQKVQSKLVARPKQKKQTFAKKVEQRKTQTATRPPQKSSFPKFHDPEMDARIRKATAC